MADTGPLIALARIGRLDLLRRLYGRVVIPPAVESELSIGSDRPGARVLEGAIAAGWIAVDALADADACQDLLMLLGAGEAEAIALAQERKPRFLLVDDSRGRRIARSRGVPVAGVPGVLLAARIRQEVEAVAPILRELAAAGYRLAPRLLAQGPGDGVRRVGRRQPASVLGLSPRRRRGCTCRCPWRRCRGARSSTGRRVRRGSPEAAGSAGRRGPRPAGGHGR